MSITNKGEVQDTIANKEGGVVDTEKDKKSMLSDKATGKWKEKESLPRGWEDALHDHIMLFDEMREISKDLGDRKCCVGKKCPMTKNGMTPGPQHFCVGCGRNICLSCIEGRMDGGDLGELYTWFYCNLYKSVTKALDASRNSHLDLVKQTESV